MEFNVTDDKGRKTAVLIDLKMHGPAVQDFWDCLIVEARRKEKDIPFEEVAKARSRIQQTITMPAGNPRPPDSRPLALLVLGYNL